jgi:hypothetical protein
MRAFLFQAGVIALCSAITGWIPPATAATAEVELYRAQLLRADAEHRIRRAECRGQPQPQRELCETQARAELTRARASARAEFKNTDRARMQADIEIAEAEHELDLLACDDDDAICRADARARLLRSIEAARRTYVEGGYREGVASRGTRALGTHECAEYMEIEQRYRCIREAEQAGRM